MKAFVSVYLQHVIFKLLLHRLHKVFKLGKNGYRNNYWLEIPLYLGTVLYLLVSKINKLTPSLTFLCFILVSMLLKVFCSMYSLDSCSWICKSRLGYVKKKFLYPCLARQADTFTLLCLGLQQGRNIKNLSTDSCTLSWKAEFHPRDVMQWYPSCEMLSEVAALAVCASFPGGWVEILDLGARLECVSWKNTHHPNPRL